MLTPKLRFKGFDESWKSLKYQDVLNIKYGKDHKLLESGDIPVYGTGGVMRYVDRSLYEGESILIGRKGTIDKPKYVNERFWTVDTLFYTEIKENAIAKFIYQHALQVNWLTLNEATGVPSLNTKSISSIEINTPCLEEQTKIAYFLSAVDDKIAQLTQEHELLGEYKKGVMQQLFSQKLRFKKDDGGDLEDWEIKTLKDIAKFSKGKGISKADISNEGINLCIRYGELYTTYGQVIDSIVSKTNVATAQSVLSNAGDVIIPASGETQIDIATASCVVNSGIILSGDLNVLRHKENGIWLAYYLSSAKKIDIAKLAQGNSVVHLYSSQLQDLEINRPSLEEQAKIANFLSSIDQKIDNVAAQIDQAQVWKKGLLQQMFV